MQLPNSAGANLDAALRALWRTGVSRRHLLEWTTADAAQAGASDRLSLTLRQHWALPVVALAIWGGLSALGIPGLRLLCAVRGRGDDESACPGGAGGDDESAWLGGTGGTMSQHA